MNLVQNLHTTNAMTLIRQLSAETRRECELILKNADARQGKGIWTFNDSTELMRLQRNARLREEADAAYDKQTERRTWDNDRPNIHD